MIIESNDKSFTNCREHYKMQNTEQKQAHDLNQTLLLRSEE